MGFAIAFRQDKVQVAGTSTSTSCFTPNVVEYSHRIIKSGKMKSTKVQTLSGNIGTFGLETPICMHMYYNLGIYRTSFQHNLHCFIDACVHVVNDYIVSNKPVES